jgi:hypothetical protein
MTADDSETPCDRCGKPRWKHHYFAGFGLLGGNGDHIYKPVERADKPKDQSNG